MSVHQTLRDAAAWRLLGRLFECPDQSWREELEALARELQDPELSAAVSAIGDQASEGRYHSVFGPGGPAPPREATYHDTLELGSLMSELSIYYDGFAYHPAIDEAPDHVAVEIGFIAFLKLKEAYALAEGDDERADRCARAASRFMTDHLATIATPLADVLRNATLDYLARAGEVLVARVGPSPSSRRLPMLKVLPDDDDGGAFPCGAP
jgi:nitrate reductase assembly molybdenum cofactor insertion protein NarJ